jgi:transcriptional regulator with XRE-family HTH domain
MSKKNLGHTIPEFVKNWRVKHGVNGAELAKKLGVTRQYVSMVERSEAMPAISFAALLYGQCNPDERDVLGWLIHEAACDHYALKRNWS